MLSLVVVALIVLFALSVAAYVNRPDEPDVIYTNDPTFAVLTEVVEDIILTPLEIDLQNTFLDEEEVIETREYYNELADIDYGDEEWSDPRDAYEF